MITDIISNIKAINNGRNDNVELFSSFGKEGYHRFNLRDYGFKNTFSVSGKYGSEYLFMNRLLAFAKINELSYTRYPSPFSDNLTDGIYFSGNDTFVAIGEDFERKIDSFDFISDNLLTSNIGMQDCQYNDFKDYLDRSINEFKAASNTHFELEKIYTAAMNFDALNKIHEELTEKISELIS